MSEVPLYKGTSLIRVQGMLERMVHHAVGAYSSHMPMRLGPPYERCRTLCLSKPCTSLIRVGLCLGPYRGTSLVRCGHSEIGRWHVLKFKKTYEKRSVARS